MFDELKEAFESFMPSPEMAESTADIILIRPTTVEIAVESAGAALAGMLEGVQRRHDRVEEIAKIIPIVGENSDAETVQNMALGNSLGLGADADGEAKRIIEATEAMAHLSDEEQERQSRIAKMEAELAELYAASDEQFTITG